MYWLVTMEKSLMEQQSCDKRTFLIINRVELLDESGCSACGSAFAGSPMGDRALIATINNGGQRIYYFCGACGDNIMGRVHSDDARQHYVWDWAVPVHNGQQLAAAA
jgi:hypothetical protein